MATFLSSNSAAPVAFATKTTATTTTTTTTPTTTTTSNVTTTGGWQVVEVHGMGKAVRATRPFNVGDVVFRETPFVSASWDEEKCTCCGQSHAVTQCSIAATMFPPGLLHALPAIEEELSNLYAIQELDKARTFLLALQKAAASREDRAKLLSLVRRTFFFK